MTIETQIRPIASELVNYKTETLLVFCESFRKALEILLKLEILSR